MRQLTEKQYELIQGKLESLFDQVESGINSLEPKGYYLGSEIKGINRQIAEKVSAIYAMLEMVEETKTPTHDGRGPG